MSYPHAGAVLRRTRTAPGLPATEHGLEIRLDGDVFAVVDLDGRTFGEVVAEATDPRGFGRLPRTMEGFMDATSTALHGPAGAPSSFTGDLATGLGMAIEAGGEPREAPARLLAPIAEQVLAGDAVDDREPIGEAEVLGRACAEYRFALTGRTTAVRTAATSVCSSGAASCCSATSRTRARPPGDGGGGRAAGRDLGLEDLVPLAHPVAPDHAVLEERVVGHELVDCLPRGEHGHRADGLVGERADQQQHAALVEIVEPCAVRRVVLHRELERTVGQLVGHDVLHAGSSVPAARVSAARMRVHPMAKDPAA